MAKTISHPSNDDTAFAGELARCDHPDRVLQTVLRFDKAREWYDARRSEPSDKLAASPARLLRWIWFSEGNAPHTGRELMNLAKRRRRYLPALRVLRPRMRVLDAGCGTGTDCLLFASLTGVYTQGIDLNSDRLAVAGMRRAEWQRIGLVTAGLVSPFFAASVLDTGLPAESFDVVWCNQAIEHIQPPEAFFREAWRLLATGGHLFIANLNARNPAASFKAALARRGQTTIRRERDPRTGRAIDYANELIRNPRVLADQLHALGFRQTRIRYSGCVPSPLAIRPALARPLLAIDRTLSRGPFAGLLAMDYVLSAQKPA